MSNKAKAWLVIGIGVVIWLVNNSWAYGGNNVDVSETPFGMLGNAIATVLVIGGVIKLVRAYRKRESN